MARFAIFEGSLFLKVRKTWYVFEGVQKTKHREKQNQMRNAF